MPTFCSQCGTALKPDAQFCEECGATLAGVGVAVKLAPSLPRGTKHRSLFWIMVGGAILLVVGGIVTLLGDWLNPDARANQLFVEASQLVHAAQEAEQTSYAEAFKLYQAALANLDKITTHYPSSQVAVQLTSGQAKVGSYPLAEFREAVPQAQVRAEAESDPLACILFVTRKDPSLRAHTLAGTASRYAEAGQKTQAAKLLSSALQATHTIADTNARARALRGIAEVYAKAGDYDRALQLAHTITDTEIDTDTKALVLRNITEVYAKAGDYDRALQLATTMEDAARKVQTWVEIIYTQAQDKQNKNSDTKRILHDIISASTALSDSEAQARLKPEVALLGKWQNLHAKETVEFFKDGTISIINDRESTNGDYKLLDDTRLRLNLGGFAGIDGPQVWKFSVSGPQLVLWFSEKKGATYRRAK